MRELIDLVGRWYGDLLVIKRADNLGRHTAWRCLCNRCGNTCVVRGNDLNRGKQVSCGRVGCKDGSPRGLRTWTQEEVDLLLATPDHEAAAILGKTLNAVRKQRLKQR